MHILSSFFKKKSIDEINQQSSKTSNLKKSLSLLELISLGIGMIVGAGIFVLTGVAASIHAGPAITLSFLLSGFVCICAGLCYAEFASMLNVSGSSYSYTYIAFGEFFAWFVGILTITGYFLGAVSVASGWSGYFTDLLSYFFEGNEFYQKFLIILKYFDLPAFFISISLGIVLYIGIELSSIVTLVSVLIKLIVLFLFIVFGIFYIDTNNWVPYIPKNTGEFGRYGLSGIIAASSMVFISFNGFDSVCTAAQETKNPKKNIPRGIILTILIVTFLYISTASVLTGIVNYSKLNLPQALAIAIKKINISWFNYFVEIGALAGLASVILVSQYTIIRMLLVIAQDGLLPKIFKKIHKKFKTPHTLTILVSAGIALTSLIADFENLAKLSSFFILFSLNMVCLGTLIMRYKKPELNRTFKCPFIPVTPIVAILISLYIMSNYSYIIYIRAIVISIIVFLSYIINKILNTSK